MIDVIKDIWGSSEWISLIRGLLFLLVAAILILYKKELSAFDGEHYNTIVNAFMITVSLLFLFTDILVAVYHLMYNDLKHAYKDHTSLNNALLDSLLDNDDVPQYLKNQIKDARVEVSDIQ